MSVEPKAEKLALAVIYVDGEEYDTVYEGEHRLPRQVFTDAIRERGGVVTWMQWSPSYGSYYQKGISTSGRVKP